MIDESLESLYPRHGCGPVPHVTPLLTIQLCDQCRRFRPHKPKEIWCVDCWGKLKQSAQKLADSVRFK